MPKTCKCGAEFEPIRLPNSTIYTKDCTDCLVKKGREKQRKYAEKQLKERHKELKKTVRANDKKTRVRSAKEACHLYVRTRDKNLPCISCGRTTANEWHASHFHDSGQFSWIRYDETNIHKACDYCNKHKHGNKIGYREGIIKRYGQEYMDRLDAIKDPGRFKKWSSEELKEVELYYKEKIKQLTP